jgi:hypothetical protein
MTSSMPYKRPNCEEILKLRNNWLINSEEFSQIENLEELGDENPNIFLKIVTKILNQPLEDDNCKSTITVGT